MSDVAKMVAEAMAHDPIFCAAEPVVEGREERARLMAEFEAESGFVLPEALVYLMVEYPGLVFKQRLINNPEWRWQRSIDGGRGPYLAEEFASIVEEGQSDYRLGYMQDQPAIAEWAPFLVLVHRTNTEFMYLDYRFDADDPILIGIESEIGWNDLPGPRGNLFFVADNYLEFLRTPLATIENTETNQPPPDPASPRAARWLKWRNQEWKKWFPEMVKYL